MRFGYVTMGLPNLDDMQRLDNAMNSIDATLLKTQYWQRHHDANLSAEQIKVLNRLLDGAKG